MLWCAGALLVSFFGWFCLAALGLNCRRINSGPDIIVLIVYGPCDEWRQRPTVPRKRLASRLVFCLRIL